MIGLCNYEFKFKIKVNYNKNGKKNQKKCPTKV